VQIPDDTMLIYLTVAQFRELQRECALAINLSKDNSIQVSAPCINTVPIEKLCELTGWSKSCVYKKTSLRQIPHHKIGKELRFNMDEINNWIKTQKRKTGEELVEEFETRQKIIMRKAK